MKSFLLKSNVFIFAAVILCNVAAKAQLKAAFSSNVTSGCTPLLVNFTNESEGIDENTEFYWDLGNGGSPSQEKNPSALFINSGTGSVTYNIRLVIVGADGTDSITKKSYITVYANPTVSFKPNITQGCPPLNVSFTDASTAGSGTIKSRLWDFGEGQLSSEKNPSTTFHYPNTYNVSLSVENSFGCKATANVDNAIHVFDTVAAAFSYKYTNLCQSPAPISFTSGATSATNISGFSWNFGDGSTSSDSTPSHTYEKQGTYKVVFAATNASGCADTITKNITVGKNGVDFTYNTVCANANIQFTDASSSDPVSSSWTFGDGTTSSETSPKHIFTNPGTYDVTLKADFGSCVGSITKKITIVAKPSAAFTASASEVCTLPFKVNFTNTSTNAGSYLWNFGDKDTSAQTNPSHTYTKAGFYNVMLIATAGLNCADTTVVGDAVKVGPPSIQSINGLGIKGCAPLVIKPGATIRSAEKIVSYKWDFGDGGTSALESPTYTYTKAGIFDVKLTVTTAGGCTDTYTLAKADTVGIAPTAAFSAQPLNVCARTPVAFTDQSTGTVTNWLWIFGDGGQSNDKSPTHKYADTGWFDVQLIAGNNGCTDTIIRKDYVYINAPVAKYQSTFNCDKPFEKTFTDKSLGADTWQWDFGDGSVSSEKSIVHTYKNTGVYTVRLKVANEKCTDSVQIKVRVVDEKPAFTYSAGSSAVCRNDVVTFTATNIDAANISTYNWIFGDNSETGDKSGAISTTHKYATAGNYLPQLITKDVLGCLDTVKGNVKATVYGPKAAFQNDAGLCINGTAAFADSSKTDGIHPLQKWVWTYEPNVTQTYSSATAFTHQYTKEGYYNVKLTVYDSYGCTDSVTRTKAVQVTNPKAKFAIVDSIRCSNTSVNLTNASTGENLVYNWNFGDNTSTASSATKLTHKYSGEGLYSVSLTVTDKFNCKSDTTAEKAVTISNPKAVISINGPTETTCPPLLIKPTSQSQHATSLSWNFGDGSLSRIDTPSHNYVMGGNFDLSLVVKGFGECYDTAHQLIKLKGPSGKLTYNPFVQCAPSTVSFSCETKDAVKVTWDFNDGVVEPDNTEHSTKHVYKNNGKYLPKLLMTDKDGCFVAIENVDTLYVSGAKADFVSTFQASCDSSLTAFLETSVPYYDNVKSFHWNFGDGTSSNTRNPEHYYSKSGTYTASLSLLTEAGCADTIKKSVEVVVHKTPKIYISAIDSVCAQSTVAFQGTDSLNETGSEWKWTFADGISTGAATSHLFTDGGAYPVKLVVTTPYNCADTATHLLNVIALPKVSAGADSFVCSGSTVMLSPSGATTYTWASDTTLSCSNCATPIAAPSVNARYFVTGANSFGCTDSDSIAIEVIKKQTISVANDTLCYGENKTLQVTGADQYQWTPALFLDNPNSGSPVFHAAKDTAMIYMVKGMDRKKCFTDAKPVVIKVYPKPEIQLEKKEIDLNVGNSIQLAMKSSPDVTQWRWEPAAYLDDARVSNPIATPRQTITYSCVASNNGSCFARDQVTIHVMCNDANMFVPNTFSPNGDGVNDRFFPRGVGVFNIKSLRVYDRWGQLVYQLNNFLPNNESNGWDGTFKGRPLDSDVYVYMLEIICQNNTVLPYKGNVTLVR